MLIVAVFVAVALLAGIEAGCGQFGCCYCHKDEGYVINQGRYYQTDCDAGYDCICNHNERKGVFYGECVEKESIMGGPSVAYAYENVYEYYDG